MAFNSAQCILKIPYRERDIDCRSVYQASAKEIQALSVRAATNKERGGRQTTPDLLAYKFFSFQMKVLAYKSTFRARAEVEKTTQGKLQRECLERIASRAIC